jgi:acyl-CoA thioesterase
VSLSRLFSLEPHGADVLVGEGHHYPWGGLYGGHIVAQALIAASSTVEEGLLPHSLRATPVLAEASAAERASDARAQSPATTG